MMGHEMSWSPPLESGFGRISIVRGFQQPERQEYLVSIGGCQKQLMRTLYGAG